MTRRRLALVAVPVALSVLVGGCGSGSTTSTTGAGSDPAASSAPQPSATEGPLSPGASGGGAGDLLEIVRSGGIAGVRDVIRVADDGTATLLTRDGRTRRCRPAPDAVRRLRGMDLRSVAALPTSGTTVNDGFTFTVRTAQGSASAGDGNDDGRRADLLDAAAGIVSACLAGVPATGGPVVR